MSNEAFKGETTDFPAWQFNNLQRLKLSVLYDPKKKHQATCEVYTQHRTGSQKHFFSGQSRQFEVTLESTYKDEIVGLHEMSKLVLCS